MPQLVTVRVERRAGRRIRIWLPVLPVLLVLSPVLILAALAGAVACLVFGVRIWPACGASWRLFCALPGTRFDVQEGRTAVLVSIR